MNLKLRHLSLKDFCGFRQLDLNLGDFACFVGPNGIGKTTILNAVSLLCSSLDFKGEQTPFETSVSAETRMKVFLRKNIRNIDETDCSESFLVRGEFDLDGKPLEVVLNEKGFVKNELLPQEGWWPGISYFAKFDVDMVAFQLRNKLWPRFSKAWEAITGFPAVDPEIYTVDKLAKIENDAEYVIGFRIQKPDGRVHCRKGSAGEHKIMKALTQIVNLEESRQPEIILVDNLEMHVAAERHLAVFDTLKDLFRGKQIIATTHSQAVREGYQPREHIINLGEAKK
jgi:predicted ATPase